MSGIDKNKTDNRRAYCGFVKQYVNLSDENKNSDCECLTCNCALYACKNCETYKHILWERKNETELFANRCLRCLDKER